MSNKKIHVDTPLDKSLKKLGGTLYKNCFSQGPDTPRGIASFTTGKTPYTNGCSNRLKWPRYFLDENLKTVYDLFIEKNYKMSFFSNPNEREFGLFPEKITNMNIHNSDLYLDRYLKNIELEENHFVFIGLVDYHWSLDDNGYTTNGERKANQDVSKSFDIIFDNFNKENFDHIFLFSDHGFKFKYEQKLQPKYMLLNEDRTNILMLHRKKGDKNILNSNKKLCAITDLFYTLDEILNKKKHKESLFSLKETNYVVIEDHMTFLTQINLSVEIWAVAMLEKTYVRDLKNGYLIDRNNNVEFGVIDEFDDILKKESSFKNSFYQHQIVFRYHKLILKQTNFMFDFNFIRFCN